MYYKYFIKWLLELLMKLALAIAVGAISIAVFMGGINNKDIVALGLGLVMNVIALKLVLNFARTIIVPWKGGGGTDLPFRMEDWESYAAYEKRMDGEKAFKNNKNEVAPN